MRLIGNFILRFIVAGIGFALAVLAAGMFIGLGFYNEVIATEPPMEDWEAELFAFASLALGFVSTLLIGFYAYATAAILIAKGYDPQVVAQVLQRVDQNEYKRHQAAPGLKVTPKAFGEGRRYPLTKHFRPIS